MLQKVLSLPDKEYRVLVPKVDADGNDVAGLRRPDDLGAPFARTRADRAATGDPCQSLKERYPNKSQYVSRIMQSAADYARAIA